MVTCFISHAWANGGHEFAKHLAEVLCAHGLKAWLDENEMHGGELFKHEMWKGVRYECDVFLFILSPKSIESKPCRVELEEALCQRDESGLQVIPILFESCNIPSEFDNLLYIDFRDQTHFDESVKTLFSSIQKASLIKALVHELIDGDSESRSESAQLLGQLRSLLTVPILIRRLSAESDPNVRHWLGFALGQIGTREAQAALQVARQTEIEPFARMGIEDGLCEASASAKSHFLGDEGGDGSNKT